MIDTNGYTVREFRLFARGEDRHEMKLSANPVVGRLAQVMTLHGQRYEIPVIACRGGIEGARAAAERAVALLESEGFMEITIF
jgi:hypothetical protein